MGVRGERRQRPGKKSEGGKQAGDGTQLGSKVTPGFPMQHLPPLGSGAEGTELPSGVWAHVIPTSNFLCRQVSGPIINTSQIQV